MRTTWDRGILAVLSEHGHRPARLPRQFTRTASAARARLIVWPEGALRAGPRSPITEELTSLARDTKAYLFVGRGVQTPAGLRNEVATVGPDGAFLGTFGKDHRVGFLGETSISRGTYPTYETPFGRPQRPRARPRATRRRHRRWSTARAASCPPPSRWCSPCCQGSGPACCHPASPGPSPIATSSASRPRHAPGVSAAATGRPGIGRRLSCRLLAALPRRCPGAEGSLRDPSPLRLRAPARAASIRPALSGRPGAQMPRAARSDRGGDLV